MNWEQDSHHVFISGATGAGKTTLAHKLFCETSPDEVAIFFNVQFEEIRGKVVRDLGELLVEFRKGNTAINYVPRRVEQEALQEEFTQLVALLFELSKKAESTEFLLVADEAHELNTGLERAVKRGRRWGIRVLVLSQEARNVSHSVLSQVKYHVWVGKPGTFEQQYLDRYGLPYETLKQQPEHGYSVMAQGGEIIEEVPEGAARYGTGS